MLLWNKSYVAKCIILVGAATDANTKRTLSSARYHKTSEKAHFSQRVFRLDVGSIGEGRREGGWLL